MTTTQEIRTVLRDLLPDLRIRYALKSLSLFGSTVRGEAHRGSDIDLLVEFDRTPTLFQFVALEQDLSDALGRKVDLVMKDALKPRIGRRILEEAEPI